MSSLRAKGRPPSTSGHIVRQLRQEIVSGHWSPGSQLPTRSAIEANFGVGPVTVQRALEELKRDGFVRVQGRQGTFVAANPPHLARYAFIFPDNPFSAGGYRFWGALNHEIEALKGRGVHPDGITLEGYYDVGSSWSEVDFDRLVADVRAHRVAGLIFLFNPYLLVDTPLLEEPSIPRVLLGLSDTTDPPGALYVVLDDPGFRTKAVTRLKALGRRRIAVIGRGSKDSWFENWSLSIAAQGLESPRCFVQGAEVASASSARNLAQLLFRGPRDERPDALVVADDNLLPAVTLGLAEVGLTAPEDLHIVAHTNFPWPTDCHLEVIRLGFDSRQVVATCLDLVDRLRGHDAAPWETLVEAKFEEELTPLPGRAWK